jgi:hypothetical protein
MTNYVFDVFRPYGLIYFTLCKAAVIMSPSSSRENELPVPSSETTDSTISGEGQVKNVSSEQSDENASEQFAGMNMLLQSPEYKNINSKILSSFVKLMEKDPTMTFLDKLGSRTKTASVPASQSDPSVDRFKNEIQDVSQHDIAGGKLTDVYKELRPPDMVDAITTEFFKFKSPTNLPSYAMEHTRLTLQLIDETIKNSTKVHNEFMKHSKFFECKKLPYLDPETSLKIEEMLVSLETMVFNLCIDKKTEAWDRFSIGNSFHLRDIAV